MIARKTQKIIYNILILLVFSLVVPLMFVPGSFIWETSNIPTMHR